MLCRMLLLFALGIFVATPALATDVNRDGVDDSEVIPGRLVFRTEGSIAIVNTGDYSVGVFESRLTNLGYTIALIPVNSGYATFIQYDMVLLPVGHGGSAHNATLTPLAADYHSYVAGGGCLWVGQPNPYDMPGGETDIPWVPYDLRIGSGYTQDDCPIVIVDPAHCITQGLGAGDLPFPADTVVNMGPEWHVLVVGHTTGRQSVFTACYGSGNILVELGHPSSGSICAYGDTGMDRMASCPLAAGPSAADDATWSCIKSLYR